MKITKESYRPIMNRLRNNSFFDDLPTGAIACYLATHLFVPHVDFTKVKAEDFENYLKRKSKGANKFTGFKAGKKFTAVRSELVRMGLIIIDETDHNTATLWQIGPKLMKLKNEFRMSQGEIVLKTEHNELKEVVELLARKMDLEPPFTKENIEKQLKFDK